MATCTIETYVPCAFNDQWHLGRNLPSTTEWELVRHQTAYGTYFCNQISKYPLNSRPSMVLQVRTSDIKKEKEKKKKWTNERIKDLHKDKPYCVGRGNLSDAATYLTSHWSPSFQNLSYPLSKSSTLCHWC